MSRPGRVRHPSRVHAELARERAKLLLLLPELFLAVQQVHRLLLDDFHAVLDILLPLLHRGGRWASGFLRVREARAKSVDLGLKLPDLGIERGLVCLQRAFLPFEDLSPRVERLLLPFDRRDASPDFLLLIQDIERFLLEEPEVLIDLRLHLVGLGADLVRIPLGRLRLFTGRRRGPTVLLGCAALVVDFFAELFAASYRARRSCSFFVRSSMRLSARWSSVARACSFVEAWVTFTSRVAVRDSKSFWR